MTGIIAQAKLAKESTAHLFRASEQQRQDALLAIAKGIRQSIKSIMSSNALDIKAAKESELSAALIDRLLLDENRLNQIASSVEDIAHQDPVLGEITQETKRENGLLIQKQRIPIGVIGMIFESRPNVVVDAAALAIKSGNAVILKGGKEAYHSNLALGNLVKECIEPFIPSNSIQLADSSDRSQVSEMLQLPQYIDLIIPRGGPSLIKYVQENSKIPVIAHYKGLCHAYIHVDADYQQAEQIVLNGKVQRPGVCNAIETLLVHKDWPQDHLKSLIKSLQAEGVEVRGEPELAKLGTSIQAVTDEDWDEEYLDLILSVKIVADQEQAIEHINRFGSKHTEVIITSDEQAAKTFQMSVDASCVAVNASSRFNDGGQLGLGAELGISTSKIHSYGPMGAREMTSQRYLLTGTGQIRQ